VSEPETPPGLDDDVTADGVFKAVQEGYSAVYNALPQGKTFNRIWRATAYEADFPIEFAHIGFLTLSEAQRLVDNLDLEPRDVLVDLACGEGGPGLWAAQTSGATLIGIDPTESGLLTAQRRAQAVGMSDQATFQRGTFEATTLGDVSVDAIMTIEAFQYAPDKRAALMEFARILRPGGRVGIVCFEVDPTKVGGVPILGVDPVADYSQLLTAAGFIVHTYEETPGWSERVFRTFGSLVEKSDALNAEMGEQAATSVLAEAMLTIAVQPYPRRVLIVAERS
jgi:ubiquinone/menaquinone biosynthesis C-methylase UbiE